MRLETGWSHEQVAGWEELEGVERERDMALHVPAVGSRQRRQATPALVAVGQEA